MQTSYGSCRIALHCPRSRSSSFRFPSTCASPHLTHTHNGSSTTGLVTRTAMSILFSSDTWPFTPLADPPLRRLSILNACTHSHTCHVSVHKPLNRGTYCNHVFSLSLPSYPVSLVKAHFACMATQHTAFLNLPNPMPLLTPKLIYLIPHLIIQSPLTKEMQSKPHRASAPEARKLVMRPCGAFRLLGLPHAHAPAALCMSYVGDRFARCA